MIHECVSGEVQKEGYLHLFTEKEETESTVSSSRESEMINTLSSEALKEEEKECDSKNQQIGW